MLIFYWSRIISKFRFHCFFFISFAEDAAVTTSPRYHQELNEHLRHIDYSGTKFNAHSVADRNQEQVQVQRTNQVIING